MPPSRATKRVAGGSPRPLAAPALAAANHDGVPAHEGLDLGERVVGRDEDPGPGHGQPGRENQRRRASSLGAEVGPLDLGARVEE